MRSSNKVIGWLVMSLLLAASCTDAHEYLSGQPTESAMSKQQQRTELSARPSLEEASSTYEKMLLSLRNQLRDEFNLPQWAEQPRPTRRSGCASQFPAISERDAGKVYLSPWFSTAALIENWQAAKKLVVQVSGKYGFNRISLDIERSGDFEFNLNDQFGAELSFGSAKYTVLTVTTGCHLTAEAKQRGSPAPS